MESSWILGGLIAIVAYLVHRLIVYPAFLSPLASIPPAHPLCAITSRWFRNRCATSRELKTLYAAHQRHGPIVRLAPNEVSVVSLEGLKKVYVAGLDKSTWCQEVGLFQVYGVQNLVCTVDHATHSRIRKSMAPLYAKSYLQRSEELDALSRRIVVQRLMPMLKRFEKDRRPIDVVQLFEWTSVDFVSGYIYGPDGGTDFLQDEASRDEYFDEWKRLRQPGASQDKPVTEALFMQMSKAAISTKNARNYSSQTSVAARMYACMVVNADEWKLSNEHVMRRYASEMVDHIIATQVTQTTMWTYILYRLSQQPQWQKALRAELLGLRLQRPVGAGEVNAMNSTDTLPSPSDIDSLPLLDAVVRETLRLHAGNPARLPRVVPSSGLELHGHYLPPGTTVSTNAYCMHRNVEAFPEPFEWKPKRWLSNHREQKPDSEAMDIKDRWFWAFGSGPRMCIAQHFAVQVLKLVTAAIYTHYTTSIVNDEGIEQSDGYNSEPVSHRLILQFHSAWT